MPREHCLAYGAPNCDCTPSEHIRRTKKAVDRNLTVHFSHITAMPVVHSVENITLYPLYLYVNYMSGQD